mgnify:CR=1 FL=1
MKKMNKSAAVAALKLSVVAVSVLGAGYATAAVDGGTIDSKSMGYKLYDIVVNDVLDGPIGFVGGLGAVVFSATQLASNWKPALFGIIGGSLAMNADTVATSLGALI